jgi:hypothetical protein
MVVVSARKEMTLNLRRAESFDVACPRQIEVAPGDKVLIRANDKRLGLINGQVLTVAGIAPDGALTTREGVSVPTEFRQWRHDTCSPGPGDGGSCRRGGGRFTPKALMYSRGRRSCIVHTQTRRADRKIAEEIVSPHRAFRDSPRKRLHPQPCQSVEAALHRPGATLRHASDSTIDRPDANCAPSKASEPESIGKSGDRSRGSGENYSKKPFRTLLRIPDIERGQMAVELRMEAYRAQPEAACHTPCRQDFGEAMERIQRLARDA